jgi:hypothetical protein
MPTIAQIGRSRFSLFAILIALVAPASAQQASGGPADDIVVTGQQYENKVVCRFEQNTGSRFQSRICHTNKEWNEIRENTLRAAHEMIDRPVVNTCRDSPTC